MNRCGALRHGIPRFVWALAFLIFFTAIAFPAGSDWLQAPKPVYPLNAALEGAVGEVSLRIVLNNDGTVRGATIVKSSGQKELDLAARAVLTWRLNKAKIRRTDTTLGREVIVDFRETEKERRMAASVLRRASEKGSAWKRGGSFRFPPDAVYPAAQRTARIRFTIATDGHPRAVQIVQGSGSQSLDAAAVSGIQTWIAYPEWIGETAEVPVTFEGPGQDKPTKSLNHSDPVDWRRYIIEHPYPEYPYDARVQHMIGSGYYLLTFNHGGRVESVQVLQSAGYAILDSAVQNAFIKWRAIPNPPFLQAKVPVTFTMTRIIDAGRWRLGQPELVGTRR